LPRPRANSNAPVGSGKEWPVGFSLLLIASTKNEHPSKIGFLKKCPRASLLATMNSSLRKSAQPDALEQAFHPSRMKLLVLEEQKDGSAPVRAFLSAARRSSARECLVLPPGDYPMPALTHGLALRAQKPGTVRLLVEASAVRTMSMSEAVWMSGVEICAGEGADVALNLTKGSLFLTDCSIRGGLACAGKEARLFLMNCHLEAAIVGLEVSGLAEAELAFSAIVGCQVGVSATFGAKFALFSSRVVKSIGKADLSPGAGLHAEAASITCEGGLFVGNEIGIHLVNCPQAEIAFSRFEQQSLGGVMMLGGGTLHIGTSSFSDQKPSGYSHVTLEKVTATLVDVEFDTAIQPDIQAQGGSVSRSGAVQPADAATDAFSKALRQIRSVVGVQKSRTTLEALLHQAHAAKARQERGFANTQGGFHCVFEGDEIGTLQRTAALMATALGALGVLSSPRVEEASLLDLLTGAMSVAEAVGKAHGGILMLTAPEELRRRDGTANYEEARSILRTIPAACGEDVIFILCGPRDVVRPLLRNSAEMEELFRAVISFHVPTPPALASLFSGFCLEQEIFMSSMAKIKVLLIFHMLDDRGDRRFLSMNGVERLFSLAQRRYLERCSRQADFELFMDVADLELPLSKIADELLESQPEFASICPECAEENPWLPGLSDVFSCQKCGHHWHPGYGIWKGSSYYRRLVSSEQGEIPLELASRRKRVPFAPFAR